MGEATDISNQEHSKAYIVSSFTTKNFLLEGVKMSTVEFPSKARTFSRSVMSHSVVSTNDQEQTDSLTNLIQTTNDSTESDDEHIEMENYISDKPEELRVNACSVLEPDQRYVVLFGKLCGRQEVNYSPYHLFL